jgi:hypothetical protein
MAARPLSLQSGVPAGQLRTSLIDDDARLAVSVRRRSSAGTSWSVPHAHLSLRSPTTRRTTSRRSSRFHDAGDLSARPLQALGAEEGNCVCPPMANRIISQSVAHLLAHVTTQGSDGLKGLLLAGTEYEQTGTLAGIAAKDSRSHARFAGVPGGWIAHHPD